MPIYEYKCKDCGAVFSVLQPINACRDCTACSKCGGKNTARIISGFSSSKSDDSCSPTGPFT